MFAIANSLNVIQCILHPEEITWNIFFILILSTVTTEKPYGNKQKRIQLSTEEKNSCIQCQIVQLDILNILSNLVWNKIKSIFLMHAP